MTAFGGAAQPEEINTLEHPPAGTAEDQSGEQNNRYAPVQDTVNGVPQPAEITTLFNDAENARELSTLTSDGSDPNRELTTLYTDGEDPLQAYHPQLTVVPEPLRHEARASTAVPGDREKHTVRNIVVATLAAVLAVRALEAWQEEAKGWERKGRFDAAGFDRRIGATFVDRLTGPLVALLPGLLLMGRSNVGDSLGVAYSQEQAAPVAARWSRAYAGKVARDYAASSTEALGAQVAEWVNKGLPAAVMAARARDVYGLDPRAAHAIARASGPEGKAKNRIGLIERYLEHRAATNASVWSMSAQNAGREMLFTELVESGLLPKHTRKVWITAHDERTCPVCKPMDNVSVPLNARFHVGGSHLMTGPVHPNCRCTISVDVHPREGFVFPKDFHMLYGWLRSATRSVYR